MTREEILAMEPGRELDAIVAEKVMGWTIGEHPELHGTGQMMVEYEEPVYFQPDGSFLCECEWYPSEDISAAWEVVEAMRYRETNGAFIDIMPTSDFYMVEAHGKEDYHVSHPNVCLAICRVALLAVMES